MSLGKWFARHPYFVFAAALSFGLALSVGGLRSLQLKSGNTPCLDHNFPCTVDNFDDREKAVMSEEQDMSKWLLSLASGALAAALATRLSGKPAVDSPSAMAAYALLIVSMFGAYLSHETRMSIVVVGPPDYVYSPGFIWPTRIQFWSLILGIAALGWSVFRPRQIAAVALVFVALMSPKARAQTFDRRACANNWFADKFPGQSVDPSTAVDFVSALERKTAISPPRPADLGDAPKQSTPKMMHAPAGIHTCEDVERVLDRARTFSMAETQTDSATGVNAYMHSLLPTLDGPNMTSSDTILMLMNVLAPWIGPFGVLYINLDKKATLPAGVIYTVLLDGRLFGEPSCHDRISSSHPHTLVISSSASMKPLYVNTQFSVADGENRVLTISAGGVK